MNMFWCKPYLITLAEDVAKLSQQGSLCNPAYLKSSVVPFSTSGLACTRLESLTRTNKFNDPKQSLFGSLLKQTKLGNKEWESFRMSLLDADRSINTINIDCTVMGFCLSNKQLSIAQSYMDYLNFLGVGPNVCTIGKLLKLYYVTYHEMKVSEKELQSILSWYKELDKMDNLDANTCESLIYGLCLTPQWEKCLSYLSIIQLSCTPSAEIYSVIIEAANKNNDHSTALKLLNDMINNDQVPMCVAFTSWLDYSTRNFKDYKLLESIEKMLQFIANNDIKVSRAVTDKLIKVFASINWDATYCYIGQSGRCTTCSQKLIPIMFSNDEFMSLREDFFNRAVENGHAFTRTTTKELEDYISFVKEKAPFKVIIDGFYVTQLIGKKRKPSDLINTMLAVVRHFTENGDKVLLLGRKNMLNWPARGLNEIRKNADVYLTDNSCFDDPYLIYAALYSGPETNFVSKDLYKQSHVFRDRSLRLIFKKWQQKHQFQIISISSGKVLIQVPLIYWPSAHKTYNSWHIPYVEEYNINAVPKKNAPANWLCLHNNSLI